MMISRSGFSVKSENAETMQATTNAAIARIEVPFIASKDIPPAN
jgi:hypothetical protein